MTAVFVPRDPRPPVDPGPGRDAASPDQPLPGAGPARGEAPSRVDAGDPEGYVLFDVGSATFAVAVTEVREILRAPRLTPLPGTSTAFARDVALVDARGRSIPVVDLRTGDVRGDVLLPVWRHHVGLVVDRVLGVHPPTDLLPEPGEVPAVLPSYARGALRPVDGGEPVLLIGMPDADELAADAARTDEPRIGEDVLDRLAGR